jgi:putative hydrolase of the HAD superfamily
MDQAKNSSTQTVSFPPGLEVLSFDAGNTLIHLPQPAELHYARLAERFDLHAPPEAWREAFRQSWKTLPRPAETPGPSPDDHRHWWKNLVRRTLRLATGHPDGNLSEADFERYFRELYEHFEQPGVWHLTEPGLPELLRALRARGYRLVVVSNFDLRLHRILRDLKVADYFEHLIISSRVGVEKPAPRIFDTARQALGDPDPAVCLHVGDDPRADWQGARAAGWHAWEFDPQQHQLRQLRALP